MLLTLFKDWARKISIWITNSMHVLFESPRLRPNICYRFKKIRRNSMWYDFKSIKFDNILWWL
jgi:hypothetical protein